MPEDRTRAPSAKGIIGTPPEPPPAQRPRRESSLPPRPSKDDPDFEVKWHRRIDAILFSDEEILSVDTDGKRQLTEATCRYFSSEG